MFNDVTRGRKMSEVSTKHEATAENGPSVQPILGRADHRLDPKRRFTIPSDWVDRMGKPAQVYVMPSLSRTGCLDVFSPSEFDQRMEPFRTSALTNTAKAQFLSRLGEMIHCCTLDTQNRIRVKDSLLSYAGIDSDTVLIGVGYHFEVWSLARRPKVDGNENALLEELSATARELGF